MPKSFRKLSKEVPTHDIKRVLALMRFRTTKPTQHSLAYASISACAHVLNISYKKTHQLLKEIVTECTSQPLEN